MGAELAVPLAEAFSDG